MFDKLIESNSEGAEFKNRRSYFVVSTVVVGILFLAAVVASIYAGDIGLGNTDLDMSQLLAPVVTTEIQPEPPRTREPNQSTQQINEQTIRQVNMPRVDELSLAPETTSVVPNTQLSRPPGDYQLGPEDSGPPSQGGTGRDTAGNGNNGTGLSAAQPVVEEVAKPEPPPVATPPRNTAPKSIGVVNGIAKDLPKPPYPAAAVAMNIQGNVDVQVMIDENGKVVSAKAVSGHPLLRGAAEKAAWGARFTPTLLSRVPVKVTGVIVYKFSR